MIDGLKLTIPGEKLRLLLEAQIQRHEQRAARWAHEQTRTPEDETEDTPSRSPDAWTMSCRVIGYM